MSQLERPRERGRTGGEEEEGPEKMEGEREQRRQREERGVLPEWIIITNGMLDAVEEVPAYNRHTLELLQSEA